MQLAAIHGLQTTDNRTTGIKKDSGQWALGRKCGTADYRAPEKQKILKRRFTQIIADKKQQSAERIAQSDRRRKTARLSIFHTRKTSLKPDYFFHVLTSPSLSCDIGCQITASRWSLLDDDQILYWQIRRLLAARSRNFGYKTRHW